MKISLKAAIYFTNSVATILCMYQFHDNPFAKNAVHKSCFPATMDIAWVVNTEGVLF